MKLIMRLGVAVLLGIGLCELSRGAAPPTEAELPLLREKAGQGDADAQNNLGGMYAKGLGVLKDESAAADWYRKAAEQGLALAQTNLGRCYAEGRGVAKDEKAAVDWFRKSAEQGYAGGQYLLGRMYMTG